MSIRIAPRLSVQSLCLKSLWSLPTLPQPRLWSLASIGRATRLRAIYQIISSFFKKWNTLPQTNIAFRQTTHFRYTICFSIIAYFCGKVFHFLKNELLTWYIARARGNLDRSPVDCGSHLRPFFINTQEGGGASHEHLCDAGMILVVLLLLLLLTTNNTTTTTTTTTNNYNFININDVKCYNGNNNSDRIAIEVGSCLAPSWRGLVSFNSQRVTQGNVVLSRSRVARHPYIYIYISYVCICIYIYTHMCVYIHICTY